MSEKPQSVEAETKVLGSMLIDPNVLPRLTKRLRPEHFSDSKHELIYVAMQELIKLGQPVTAITVADTMRRLDSYKKAGGSEYLMSLMAQVATTEPVQLDHYARMVTDRFLQRSLIQFGTELVSHSAGTDNPHELIKFSSEMLQKMNGSVGGGDQRLLQGSINAGVLAKKDVHQPASIIGDGVMTESSFVLLYGKPGLGKTWLALQAALAVAVGKPWLGLETRQSRVAIIEMEMHEYYLKQRLLELVALMDAEEGREALANIELIVRPNFTGPIDLMQPATRDGIINWVNDKGCKMLVLDAMSRMHYASEVSAQDMGQVLGSIETIRDETQAGIMGIHHEPKDRSKREGELSDLDAARGSTRMQSDPHTMMRLKVWKGRHVLMFAKMNLGAPIDPIFLQRQASGHFIPTQEPAPEKIREQNLAKTESLLLEAGHGGTTAKLLATQMKLAPRTVKKYLDEVGTKIGNAYIHNSLIKEQLSLDGPGESEPDLNEPDAPKEEEAPEEPPPDEEPLFP